MFQNSPLDSKKHLLPLSLHITIHNHLARNIWRVSTTYLPVTGWLSSLCYTATPSSKLEKNQYKLQLSNAGFFPSEISLQPPQNTWESHQNKILQTSQLWHWHGFLLVFRWVHVIDFLNNSSYWILPIFSALKIHGDSIWITVTPEPAACEDTKNTPENNGRKGEKMK